jgi:subtilisin family serine protease
LNMSFSTREVSETLRRAVLYAQGKGVALVASAGNENRDAAAIYPASYPQVSAVAATDFNDRLASFSNYGSVVSLSAPGAYLISTAPAGRYAMVWGTSFSAPIVSGSVALLNARFPKWPPKHGDCHNHRRSNRRPKSRLRAPVGERTREPTEFPEVETLRCVLLCAGQHR